MTGNEQREQQRREEFEGLRDTLTTQLTSASEAVEAYKQKLSEVEKELHDSKVQLLGMSYRESA